MVLSLWNIFAMAAVAVDSAAASTQDRLQAVSDHGVAADVLAVPRTVSVDNVTSEFGDLLTTGADDWEAYKGLPVVGTLQAPSTNPPRALLIANHWDHDRRDAGGESVYLFLHNARQYAAVVLVHPAGVGGRGGGAILEIVKNKLPGNQPPGPGWFLAVHDAFPRDSKYAGSLRLIAHRDQRKAAVFKFVPKGDKMMLQVVQNLAATGQASVGGYVVVPDGATRDARSDFLAVSTQDKNRVEFVFMAET